MVANQSQFDSALNNPSLPKTDAQDVSRYFIENVISLTEAAVEAAWNESITGQDMEHLGLRMAEVLRQGGLSAWEPDQQALERIFAESLRPSVPVLEAGVLPVLSSTGPEAFSLVATDLATNLYDSSRVFAELGLPRFDVNALAVAELTRQLMAVLPPTPAEGTSGLPMDEVLSVASVAIPSVIASSLENLVAGMLPERSGYEVLQQQLEFNALVA